MEKTLPENNIGTLLIKSYAKINLSLYVDKKTDVYHPISSLVVPIDVFDRIKLIPSDEISADVSLRCDCFGNFSFIPPEDNTALKAIKKYNEYFGTRHCYKIIIDKRIPVGGGLGGSSADAAGVLRLLSYLDQRDKSELVELAAEIGKDVPFMLYSRPAVMSGFGERVELLPSLDMDITLIYVPQPNMTAGIFREYDKGEIVFDDKASKLLYRRLTELNAQGLDQSDEQYISSINSAGFYNSLMPAACRVNIAMADIIQKLEEHDIHPIMTGSGSYLFLPYYCDVQLLRRYGIRAMNVKTI